MRSYWPQLRLARFGARRKGKELESRSQEPGEFGRPGGVGNKGCVEMGNECDPLFAKPGYDRDELLLVRDLLRPISSTRPDEQELVRTVSRATRSIHRQ